MEHKREGASGSAGWATLSHPLMEIIFAKAYEPHKYCPHGLQAILNLRLVCKGWRDACSDYTGPAYIECKEHTDLLKICEVLPGLCDLTLDILNSEADTFFNVLSKLTSLHALSVSQTSSEKKPVHDLGPLPSTLKELSMEHIAIDPLFDDVSFIELTCLSCNWPDTLAEGAFKLLQHLPALKELDFESGGLFLHDWPEEELGAVFRCTSLTKLSLCFGLLTTPIHMPASASTLRHMHLSQMDFSAQWFHTMAPLLTSLTQLDLSQCDINPGDAQKLQAISSLRALDMYSSTAQLLCLAGPDLQHLKYGGHALDAHHFATLGALTYLELNNVHTCIPAGARPNPSSQLLELSLNHSDIMTEALLLPGTLPVLQKLNLVEKVRYTADARSNTPDQEGGIWEATGLKACDLYCALFRQSSLKEVSGRCRLFLLGIPEKLVRWDGSERDSLVDESASQHGCLGSPERTFLKYPAQVWKKI